MSNPPPDRRALIEQLNREHGTPHGGVHLEEVASYPGGELARYRLDNGLSVLVLHDPSAPVVAYHTWFRVGSRDEKPGKTGLAHLFEHLMFNETESLPAGEFDRTLEAAGGEVNAATWVDWTYYYETLPSSELETAVRLEADRMAHLVLRDPQVSSEKEVVANERRYRVDDDVEGFVNEQLYKLSYDVHPYRWPTIGWMEDIEGFSTEDCRAFYGHYYAPDNASVVIVGDVQEGDALRLVQRYYGGLPAAGVTRATLPREPEPTAERRHELTQPTPTEKLLLGYRAPALGHEDHVAIAVLSEVLFGGRSSRLYRALVTENELASEVRGGPSPFEHPGLFEIWVSLREGLDAERALEAVEAVLTELARSPLDEAELQKAKNRSELHFLQGMETAQGKAEQIGFYHTVLDDPLSALRMLEATRSLDAERVQHAARTYLTPERRTTLLVRCAESAHEEVA